MILNELLNQTLPFEVMIFGNNTGKKITIVGGAHGNEHIGAHVAMSLVQWLQQFDLKGQIYLIPFASPEALHLNTREFKNIDLNRQFSSKNLPTLLKHRVEQIKKCIDGSELVIDCHGASHAEEIKWPFVYCDPRFKKYGGKFPTDVILQVAPAGSLRDYCLKLKIPCLTIESIDSRQKESIKIAMIGLYKLLKMLGFIFLPAS
jgi:predicted deacylase